MARVLHPSVAVPRTITEIKAGKPGPTVLMSSASYPAGPRSRGVPRLVSTGWPTSAASFQDIKEAAMDRVPAELKGKWGGDL